jgi:capsular polysaccharide transport system ATP-binding protein
LALLDKRDNKKAGFIVVSHQMDIVRKFCSSAVVLAHGGARHYADLEEAIKAYQSNG